MFLIAGLGNPGREYENTRHNLGFMAIDLLGRALNVSVTRDRFRALTADIQYQGHRIFLAKPQTFMNLSGESISEIVKWNKIDLTHVVIICDDLDTDIGKIRVRSRGGAAGHKGIESVIGNLGTEEFIRIRIGIGGRSIGGDNSEYVLERIPSTERGVIDQAVQDAADAALTIVRSGIDAAMNTFNK